MRSPTELTSAFRERGLKITPQRQLLFALLHGNEAHPTAEALHAVASDRMPGISLRTVYQTLNDLAEMGELQLLDLGTGSSRFDPNTGDHHHLVCDTCGDVRDVHLADARTLEPASSESGFVVSSAHIVFRGQCRTCAGGTVESSTGVH